MNNRKFRFTNRSLDALPPCPKESPSKAQEYSDQECPGLKAQVSKSGHIVLYYRYVFKGTKRAARLGAYPGISIAEARQQVIEYRGILDRGGDPQEPRDRAKNALTFEKFALDVYLPHVIPIKRSANADESKLRTHLLPHFRNYRLPDISVRDIESYLSKIGKRLAPATLNRHTALLSKMFSVAIKFKICESNPCKQVEKRKEDNQLQRFLNEEEVGRLLQAMEYESNKTAVAALTLLLYTCTRRSECLSAKWIDINLDSGTWLLKNTKSSKQRYVKLSQAAIKLLQSRLPTKSPYVFPSHTDPLNKPYTNLKKPLERILQRARLNHTRFRVHDLRHTGASLLCNNGVDLYTVQKILGHSTPKMTMRYSHIADKTLQAASDTLSTVVNRAAKGTNS